MKRSLSLFLCLLLFALPILGCSGGSNQDSYYEDPDDGWHDDPYYSDPTKAPQSYTTPAPMPTGSDFSGRDDIAYVLIFNPNIYKETLNWNEKLTTGSIGQLIDVSMARADELEPFEPEFKPYQQTSSGELFAGYTGELDLNRAGGIQPIYSLGDTRQFYAGDEYRSLQTFECVYAGSHCYVWSTGGSVSTAQANKIGSEFDNKIYDADVTTFGTPRYEDEGGKIHLLYYPMTDGLLGFFWPVEIFATGEYLTEQEAEYYGANQDLAIINLNSDLIGYPQYEEMIFATTAHEFQHLINASDLFYTVDPLSIGYISTWLNESMSGYIEEKLYPGVKDTEGHYEAFASSYLIKHGQSMFNFSTEFNDIGVYGSVYLFSQYLENLAGGDVFRNIHDYWRNSYSRTLCDAEALHNSISSSVAAQIEAAYSYPGNVRFDSADEEWMSKLILDFYMSLLSFDAGDPAAYAKVQAQTLLYDEINPADIEGGGRVIAATKDGTFEIPADADYGLLYIGLDSNFQPVTGIVYK